MAEQVTRRGSGAGRPRSVEKRDAILAAARALFLEHGLAEASMDAVTARAGVSKSTIYGHFETKEELFEEVVRVRAEEVLAQLIPAAEPSGDPAADLETLGVAFQRVLLVPEARAWNRLVIAEADRRPQVARTLFESGPARLLGLVATYLGKETQAGRLRVERPAEAAEHFIGLIGGVELIRGLLASQPARTDRDRRQRARRAVAVFLAAYGPTRGGG